MPADRTRLRRIVRTAVIVVAIPVLLVTGYLCSLTSIGFGWSAGLIPDAYVNSAVFDVYVFPWEWYVVDSGWPGAAWCEAVVELSCEAGEFIQIGTKPSTIPPSSI